MNKKTEIYNLEEKIGSLKFSGMLTDGFFFSRPTTSSVHDHRYIEIQYVHDGYVEVLSDKNLYTINKNEVIVIPSGIYHQTKYVSPDHVRTIIRLQIEEVSSSKIQTPIDTSVFYSDESQLLVANEDTVWAMTSFRRHCEENKCGSLIRTDEITHSKLNMLFGILISDILLAGVHEKNYTKSADVTSESSMVEFLDSFFFKNLQTDVTISDLAVKLGYSPSQTSRIIKHHYSKTFKKKLIEIRMETACQKLKNTNAQIKDIARAVGYKSSKSFEDAFSKYIGMTPARYRKNYR